MSVMLSLLSWLLLVMAAGGGLHTVSATAEVTIASNSAAVSAYWHKMLPNTVMPLAILELLTPPAGITDHIGRRNTDNVNFGAPNTADSVRKNNFGLGGPHTVEGVEKSNFGWSGTSTKDGVGKSNFGWGGAHTANNVEKSNFGWGAPHKADGVEKNNFGWGGPHTTEGVEKSNFGWSGPSTTDGVGKSNFGWGGAHTTNNVEKSNFGWEAPHKVDGVEKNNFGWGGLSTTDGVEKSNFGWGAQHTEEVVKKNNFGWGGPSTTDVVGKNNFGWGAARTTNNVEKSNFGWKAPHTAYGVEKNNFGWGSPSTTDGVEKSNFGWGAQHTSEGVRKNNFGWGVPSTTDSVKKSNFGWGRPSKYQKGDQKYVPLPEIGESHMDRVNDKHGAMSNVFLEEALKLGSIIPCYVLPSHNIGSPLLRRDVADSIPMSTRNFTDILTMFAPASNGMAADIWSTLEQCDHPDAIKGEKKACATSVESMVEYSASVLGVTTYNLRAFSSPDAPAEGIMSGREYKVTATTRITEAKDTMTCHGGRFPFAVFMCHAVNPTKVYSVTLEGNGVGGAPKRMEVLAVCHLDTSDFDPARMPLHVKPGDAPLCHFLSRDSILWAPAAAA